MAIKHPEYGRMSLVDEVGEHVEPVLHVVSPALDGVHGHVVALELPGLGELRVQDVQTSEALVLHHLRHFPFNHLDGIPARLDDGLHLVRVEEVTPQRQADAQQEQGLRSEQKVTHDPTEQRQQGHGILYHRFVYMQGLKTRQVVLWLARGFHSITAASAAGGCGGIQTSCSSKR